MEEMNTSGAGLIFDDSPHYLDHLAPFCALLGWPLIVCDERIAALCKKFYPMTQLIEADFFHLNLPACVVSCNSRPSLTLALGPLSSWQGRLIWLPHGQSDKGWKSPYFEALGTEDLLLVYGDRMREVLRRKNIRLPQISVGNYRWQFYQTHRSFYNQLLDQQLRIDQYVLYAPTWNDSEQNGSFWAAFDSLIHAVPPEQHLLIKVHPNIEKLEPGKLERCRGKIASLPHVSFIDEFPPVYPLLDRATAYIGDMSSIGYDYLRFGRPLFFLTPERIDLSQPHAYLMQWGTQILYEEIGALFSRPFSPHQALALFEEIDLETTVRTINQWVSWA
jgi:CDP-glycerol glycerophosphotransferase (TagB/SpsB family)